ncbi:MAG: nucleotidyltransferase [Chloroflexi bacterium]|nr:nucleotidyltransferase [Chloroflexota bacterium]MBI5349334.1 nucleotidyltransferase [Chloroflexota bacterium]
MTTTNFERIINLLSENKVDFVIIGGLAATVHGSAYVTYDMDICYDRLSLNVDHLCDALTKIHPKLRGAPDDVPFKFDSPTVLAGLNFTLDTDYGALDLLGEVEPLGEFERVVQYSEVAELFGFNVRVLSLDGLIRAKRKAGRKKDLLVLPELEALLEMQKKQK